VVIFGAAHVSLPWQIAVSVMFLALLPPPPKTQFNDPTPGVARTVLGVANGSLLARSWEQRTPTERSASSGMRQSRQELESFRLPPGNWIVRPWAGKVGPTSCFVDRSPQ
jgi:hypothetical protein